MDNGKMSLLKQRNITGFVNKKNHKLIFFWESNNLKISNVNIRRMSDLH